MLTEFERWIAWHALDGKEEQRVYRLSECGYQEICCIAKGMEMENMSFSKIKGIDYDSTTMQSLRVGNNTSAELWRWVWMHVIWWMNFK